MLLWNCVRSKVEDGGSDEPLTLDNRHQPTAHLIKILYPHPWISPSPATSPLGKIFKNLQLYHTDTAHIFRFTADSQPTLHVYNWDFFFIRIDLYYNKIFSCHPFPSHLQGGWPPYAFLLLLLLLLRCHFRCRQSRL